MRPRLLVVDDEAVNCEIIAEYLEAEDCSLTMASDGGQALDLLHAADAAFDAVVLDRMMPGIDGIEVLRQIKATPGLRSLPVILQTAAAGREQVAEGLKLGAYYYLTKPYHRDALVAVVRAALADTAQRRDLARRIEESRAVMALIERGTFQFRTLEDARALAAAFAALCEEPDLAGMGLVELLVNAVEHGNLGITFHEKSELLSAGRWEEEVGVRLQRPENLDKTAELDCWREGACLVFAIRDRGTGFAWERFLSLDETRAFQPNGRGIALARNIAFRTLEYRGCGNEVVVSAPARRPSPVRPPGTSTGS
jgi:CheY-like chemotaxis protein